jgi:hypothetical protein
MGERLGRDPLQIDTASFDRLRMRKNFYGLFQGPFSFLLILSLSKDAEWTCSGRLRRRSR